MFSDVVYEKYELKYSDTSMPKALLPLFGFQGSDADVRNRLNDLRKQSVLTK